MARILVSTERSVEAPAETVYGYIADMREQLPKRRQFPRRRTAALPADDQADPREAGFHREV